MSTIANLCVIWTQSENLPKIKNLGLFFGKFEQTMGC